MANMNFLSRKKQDNPMSKTKYAQKIIHFFCRPCGEYHLKTHPHYRAMKRRAAKRKKVAEATAKTAAQQA
jgi:hypothetical protein